MVLMTTLYILIVWLVFGKFKLLPFNGFWRTIQGARLTNRVDLHLALGGSFDSPAVDE